MASVLKEKTTYVVLLGSSIVIAILILGTIWTEKSARKDATDSASSVSLLYLDELASRREQVVENNLKGNIRTLKIAIEMISETDLSNIESLRAYQRRMKQLFNLKRFAFVDKDGSVYTADEGIRQEANLYSFDYNTISNAEISVRRSGDSEKHVVIAMPIHDRNYYIEGKQLVVCFMESNMDVILGGASLRTQNSDVTFCNIFTKDGSPLSNLVLGGLAAEDNLLEALEHA